jgi:outer membrane protein OmpA-like peptidoglycan-associated protein
MNEFAVSFGNRFGEEGMMSRLGTLGRRVLPVLGVASLIIFGTGAALAGECKAPTGMRASNPHTIHFETDSTEIGVEDQAWLKAAAERHKEHPSVQVCVLGQADKQGDMEYNKKLALRRAEAVASFLKNNGLGDKTFQIVGRGEAFGDSSDSLLSSVFGDENLADRRVEVKFYR